MRTWDSPAVADLAWGARGLELRLLREIAAGRLARGRADARGARAARGPGERLGVPRLRRQAGDYPLGRVLDHARELFEVIDSGAARTRPDAQPGARPVPGAALEPRALTPEPSA